MSTPRIAAIHDLSCFGRCSLTIALPVLSAMGLECAVLPTAVLSAHTAFEGFRYEPLSLTPVADHFFFIVMEKIEIYTQKPSPTTILVICHKEKNADKRSAFYKGCAANGAVLESVRPRDYEIASWLQRFIAGKGLAIDTKALSMLTDHLGTDISKISNELGKLVVSLPEGTKRITDADIEANIGISKDYNNFELCKAVATRDMARALMIAEHFARNPKDNPLLVTVLALFGQFKELFVVNYLRWLSRHKGTAFPPDTELMRILKKSNVYVIGEIKQNAANWDNRKVFNILGLLREYDAKSKGMNAGGASDGELLRELLLKIFML